MPGNGFEILRLLLNAFLLAATVQFLFYCIRTLMGSAVTSGKKSSSNVSFEKRSNKDIAVEPIYESRFQPAVSLSIVSSFFAFLLCPLVIRLVTVQDHMKTVRAAVVSLIFLVFYGVFFLFTIKKQTLVPFAQQEVSNENE